MTVLRSLLLPIFFFAMSLLFADNNNAALAWTTGSAVSSFGGSVLLTGPSASSPTNSPNTNLLEMRQKGKSKVPPAMRSQYKRQQEMSATQKQMMAAQKAGSDGLPVFNLFVRTRKANMWYPCGSFKGDDRTAGLAKNYANGGMLSGVSKKQLDGGISGSLFQDQKKLTESICRSYPQLRKSRDEFEFGYRLSYEGLSEEKAKEIFVVEPKEQKGVVDNIKNIFS